MSIGRKITLRQLEYHLFKAIDILRGRIDAPAEIWQNE